MSNNDSKPYLSSAANPFSDENSPQKRYDALLQELRLALRTTGQFSRIQGSRFNAAHV